MDELLNNSQIQKVIKIRGAEPQSLIIAAAILLVCEGNVLLFRIYFSHMESIMVIRTLEITGMMLLIKFNMQHSVNNSQFPEFASNRIKHGIKCGLIWSLIFALLILIAGVCFYLITGIDPMRYLRFTLPDETKTVIFFLITGGVISPVAEEIFFRGLLYSFLRRYGVTAAVVISTALFALCHLKGDNIPIIQMTGGVIFAVAFEQSGSIITPLLIHMLGNLSIFAINIIFH